jgi:hypothetical protein
MTTILRKLLNHRVLLVAAFGCTVSFAVAGSCKAQEANPDHFTATGVEAFGGLSQRDARVSARPKTQAASSTQASSIATLATTKPKAVRQRRRTNATHAAGQ